MVATIAAFSVCLYGAIYMEVDFDHKRTIPEGTYLRYKFNLSVIN